MGSVVVVPWLWSTGSVVVMHEICGIWALPGPGIEPMSPALAGRFFTTEPPAAAVREDLKLYLD